MQTARRATTSVTNACDQCIPSLGLLHDVSVSRRAKIALNRAYHFRDTMRFKQLIFDGVEEGFGAFLAIGKKPDGSVPQRWQSDGKRKALGVALVGRIEDVQIHELY